MQSVGRANNHSILAFIIMLLAVWTMFSNLGGGSLNDWDEATYAEIAREMNDSGDWTTPHWNGYPFHDKPPLIMWLMALAMKAVTSVELAARLPAAAFGVGAIIMTALLGRVLFCAWTGLVAATLLLLSSASWWSNFVMLSRQGMLDVPLVFFALWTFLHLYLGIKRPVHWLLMGIPLGLAIMTKSFLSAPIVLTLLIFVLILHAEDKLSREHWAFAAWAALVALLIFLPWHLVELVEHGRDFLNGYILIHLMKTVHREGGGIGNSTFYLWAIRTALPSIVWVCIPAIGLAIWRGIRLRDHPAILLLIWVTIPLTLFSPLPTKLPWYILPIIPALVLLIALFLRSVVPANWIAETLVLLAIIGAVGAWNFRTLKPVDESRDVKALGKRVVSITPPNEVIAYYEPSNDDFPELRPTWNIRPSVLAYARSPIVRIRSADQLDRWIERGGRFVWAGKSVQLPASFKLIERAGDERYLVRDSGS